MNVLITPIIELNIITLSPLIVGSLLATMIITDKYKNDIILTIFLFVQIVGYSILAIGMFIEMITIFLTTSTILTLYSLFRRRDSKIRPIRRHYKMIKAFDYLKSKTISSIIVGVTAIMGLQGFREIIGVGAFDAIQGVLLLATAIFAIKGRVDNEKNVVVEKRKF